MATGGLTLRGLQTGQFVQASPPTTIPGGFHFWRFLGIFVNGGYTGSAPAPAPTPVGPAVAKQGSGSSGGGSPYYWPEPGKAQQAASDEAGELVPFLVALIEVLNDIL